MTTKEEMIEIIKAENPTLQVGDDERGYTQLSDDEYNTVINEWADARIEKEIKKAEAEAQAAAEEAAKVVAQEKLTALGLTVEDLQALGL